MTKVGLRQEVVEKRVTQILDGFPRYVAAYDRLVPFTSEQLAAHRKTIELRRQAGSIRVAVTDPGFVASLRRTLMAWGLGVRGSILVPTASFAAALVAALPVLEPLESLQIDHSALPLEFPDQLWNLIRSLEVVENKAKLVAGTKTLHHLLPDLVVPMDREWTGKFFGLHPPEWQDPANQRRILRSAYAEFIQIARHVKPGQYVTGQGWRTSRTKVIDNALIGFCKVEMATQPTAPAASPSHHGLSITRQSLPESEVIVSNRDRVGRAFELLATGLGPYVDRRMRASNPVETDWIRKYVETSRHKGPASLKDPSFLLKVMADCWKVAFSAELPWLARNYVFELRNIRNDWAHNEEFTTDEALRALDTVERLLVAIDALKASQVRLAKEDLARRVYDLGGAFSAELTPRSLVEPPEATPIRRPSVGRSRYEGLREYLSQRTEPVVKLSFVQIEHIIERSLPQSARDHRPWWSNTQPHARYWRDAGRRTTNVDLNAGTVEFVR